MGVFRESTPHAGPPVLPGPRPSRAQVRAPLDVPKPEHSPQRCDEDVHQLSPGLADRGAAAAYAPDLNSAEGVWANMKNGLATSPPPTLASSPRSPRTGLSASSTGPRSSTG